MVVAAAVSEPEANERGSSLIGKKSRYMGIESLFLTRRKESWLCANERFRARNKLARSCGYLRMGTFRMRSRLARNCGYAGMGDLECAVDYHLLFSYPDFQLQFAVKVYKQKD